MLNILFLTWRFNRIIRRFEKTRSCFMDTEAMLQKDNRGYPDLLLLTTLTHNEFTQKREVLPNLEFHYLRQTKIPVGWIRSFIPETPEYKTRHKLAKNITRLGILIESAQRFHKMAIHAKKHTTRREPEKTYQFSQHKSALKKKNESVRVTQKPIQTNNVFRLFEKRESCVKRDRSSDRIESQTITYIL